jgi:hypothetical protein
MVEVYNLISGDARPGAWQARSAIAPDELPDVSASTDGAFDEFRRSEPVVLGGDTHDAARTAATPRGGGAISTCGVLLSSVADNPGGPLASATSPGL